MSTLMNELTKYLDTFCVLFYSIAVRACGWGWGSCGPKVTDFYGFSTPVTHTQVLIEINFQAPKTL